MPTPKNKYDREHLQRLQRLQYHIDVLYGEATREAAAIGATVSSFNPDKPFTFDDYPKTRKRADRMIRQLGNAVEVCVVNGVNSEWTLANNKNNELANKVFGDNVGKLSQAQYRRYYSTNDTACAAFLSRKETGLSLSDRVWRYSDEFKEEMEMGIDLGLRHGLSADQMARDLQQYLRHPDMLFRRVKDEHGLLHLSKRAAAFHPGRGVYRSSYMNARRLAATEANIAYRTSDHLRWQKMDFVVGVEIHLSNNHNCKGVPAGTYYDICDELKGKYPKDFKFTGWHPHCRCYATPVLKTDKEIARDTQKILKGQKPDAGSENKVGDVPQKFKEWLARNEKRVATRYSVPYFIEDNLRYVPQKFLKAYASRMPYETYEAYEWAMKYNKTHARFSKEIEANNKELSRLLPVVQGQIMNFTKADRGKVNPDSVLFDAEPKGFLHNCQTCTVAYELRRRGFDVEAVANKISYHSTVFGNVRDMDLFFASNNINWRQRFLNADGSDVSYVFSDMAHIPDTPDAKNAFIRRHTREPGRYEVYCKWKKGGAHVFIVEKTEEGSLIWYDPQVGAKGASVNATVDRMRFDGIGVLRIDDKLINPKMAERLLRARKPV